MGLECLLCEQESWAGTGWWYTLHRQAMRPPQTGAMRPPQTGAVHSPQAGRAPSTDRFPASSAAHHFTPVRARVPSKAAPSRYGAPESCAYQYDVLSHRCVASREGVGPQLGGYSVSGFQQLGNKCERACGNIVFFILGQRPVSHSVCTTQNSH